jgi:alkylation response protein AidB-like acyl-CoA dehydrogenase
MDLNLSDEQQQLVDTFSALYAKESNGERVRAVEATGFDPALWERLVETGVVEMAVDEGSGGWGATLLDLSLVAEQHGRHLGSVPLIEAQAAARLLARAGTASSKELLEQALSGDALVSVALHAPRGDTLRLAPAGAVADTIVFFDDGRLLAAESKPAATAVANLGALPVADVTVGETTELLAGPAAADAYEEAVDDWLALMAGALTGLARRSLEIGVDYVKERHAFGVPIGSFQAVAHGLADAATAVDGAELLSREAAWSAGEEPGRFRELAALSFGFSADAARQASYASLHYHGGYGFMMEYDIQLYYRRAKAWPAQYGEPDMAFARAEARRLGLEVR